jgi:arsenate reductase
MKKAFRWLETQGIDYQFHDYKKLGVGADKLAEWCEKTDWNILLNKRGLTWRRLSDTDKQDVDEDKAICLMARNPSLIKRPVLECNGHIEVGFSPERYVSFFNL